MVKQDKLNALDASMFFDHILQKARGDPRNLAYDGMYTYGKQLSTKTFSIFPIICMTQSNSTWDRVKQVENMSCSYNWFGGCLNSEKPHGHCSCFTFFLLCYHDKSG